MIYTQGAFYMKFSKFVIKFILFIFINNLFTFVALGETITPIKFDNSINKLSDIENHNAKNVIIKWTNNGIFTGDEHGFRPNDNITLAEISTIINKLMGYEKKSKNPFNNLNEKEWYADAILISYEAGIISGDEKGQIFPEKSISKDLATSIISRSLGIESSVTILNDTNDITRAEVVMMIDDLISKYYSDDYKNNLFLGNLGQPQKNINVPILMFHHLSLDSSKWNYITMSPDRFEEKMHKLKQSGFNTISFKDYIDYINGKMVLPKNPIIITFDDGYYSNYEYAFPILKKLNMKATISVVGWSMGRELGKDNISSINKHFTWEQAKEMYDSGLIDIQSHSYDLHDYNRDSMGVNRKAYESQEQYEKRFKDDTYKMMNLIKTHIGNEPLVYTYPYGIYNETTEKVLKELGYKVTLTTIDGVSEVFDDLFLLKRINVQ